MKAPKRKAFLGLSNWHVPEIGSQGILQTAKNLTLIGTHDTQGPILVAGSKLSEETKKAGAI